MIKTSCARINCFWSFVFWLHLDGGRCWMSIRQLSEIHGRQRQLTALTLGHICLMPSPNSRCVYLNVAILKYISCRISVWICFETFVSGPCLCQQPLLILASWWCLFYWSWGHSFALVAAYPQFTIGFSNLGCFWPETQNPTEADKLLKIQRDLDETKVILVQCSVSSAYVFYKCIL
jgi:hypothetical protein